MIRCLSEMQNRFGLGLEHKVFFNRNRDTQSLATRRCDSLRVWLCKAPCVYFTEFWVRLGAYINPIFLYIGYKRAYSSLKKFHYQLEGLPSKRTVPNPKIKKTRKTKSAKRDSCKLVPQLTSSVSLKTSSSSSSRKTSVIPNPRKLTDFSTIDRRPLASKMAFCDFKIGRITETIQAIGHSEIHFGTIPVSICSLPLRTNTTEMGLGSCFHLMKLDTFHCVFQKRLSAACRRNTMPVRFMRQIKKLKPWK